MASRTAVEDYVDAAVRHAFWEELGDGTLAATVPECFGVIAFGASRRECETDLRKQLEDWIRVRLANGIELPVIDGIALDAQNVRLPGRHRIEQGMSEPAEFFENEEDFERALDRWEEAP